MKLDRFVRRLTEGVRDVAKLRVAGELLGNELPRNRLDALRDARTAIARLSFPEGSFAAGYAAALADVMAAYEAAVEAEHTLAEAASSAVKAGSRDVLCALAEGASLPTEIGEHSGRPVETVSRILNQLRTAGLAHQVDPPAGGDRRSRPHQLTDVGRQVVARLPTSLPTTAAEAIRFAVTAFAHLARTRATPISALAELATPMFDDQQLRRAAASRFIEAARGERIATADEDEIALLPTRADEQARVVDALERATREANQSALIAKIRSFLTQGMKLLVRPTERSRQSWLLLTVTSDVWGKVRLVNPKLDVIDAAERFAILYDDPSALASDTQDVEVEKMYARAERRACIASKSATLPALVERVPLEELS